VVDPDELRTGMHKLGLMLSHAQVGSASHCSAARSKPSDVALVWAALPQVEDIVRVADFNRDGCIDFREFMSMFGKKDIPGGQPLKHVAFVVAVAGCALRRLRGARWAVFKQPVRQSNGLSAMPSAMLNVRNASIIAVECDGGA
jgi:hypothetical protein